MVVGPIHILYEHHVYFRSRWLSHQLLPLSTLPSHHQRGNPYITEEWPYNLHLHWDSCDSEGSTVYNFTRTRNTEQVHLGQTISLVTLLLKYGLRTKNNDYTHSELILNSHTVPLTPWPLFPEQSYIFPLSNLCVECPSCLSLMTFSHLPRQFQWGPLQEAFLSLLLSSEPPHWLPLSQDIELVQWRVHLWSVWLCGANVGWWTSKSPCFSLVLGREELSSSFVISDWD